MSTSASTAKPKKMQSQKRSDYRAPSHTIDEVKLSFELDPNCTQVEGVFSVVRLGNSASSLFLDGEDLTLISLSINGNLLTQEKDYKLTDSGVEIFCQLDSFELCVKNTISPIQNTSLEGLYFSNDAYCTQCEAQGFRKITYFLDRPDVLACYEVTIISHTQQHAYLLSNGNLVSDTGYVDGKRTCVWQDPFPKPSYLFALVAGDFDKLEDSFRTQSNKQISLQLFVDKGRKHQGQHALDSLKKSMKWDEQTYGLEYDLDIYMIVAVDFFNMGAMENKGLNVFNSKFVLAEPETATDEDYFNIESIIAHEYFHNWTGNRVTCRDWFQLSLKEGLTVFRDQQFSAEMYSDLVTRISQVKVMREHQFAEDASPMSHPIRPDEVMEMNNFYTVTVYDKGAEVIRMLHTLLGKSGFRKGLDLYFSRHDGQAVTCDDFVQAMQDANEHDLSHFKLWYSQSGTPLVNVKLKQQSNGKSCLVFTQTTKATHDQQDKKALYIPIKIECFDKLGTKIPLGLENDTFVLNEASKTLEVASSDSFTPSILQDFSAPVKVSYDYSIDDLMIIVENATNHYAKWEAMQSIYEQLIKKRYIDSLHDKPQDDLQNILNNIVAVLSSLDIPDEVTAELITVPSSESLFSSMSSIDPITLDEARESFIYQLASHAEAFILARYEKLHLSALNQTYVYEKNQVNARKLKNTCLQLLASISNKKEYYAETIKTQFFSTNNMTDKLAALKAASICSDTLFSKLMLAFEEQFQHDTVVMDKWFALHAKDQSADILSKLDLLKAHKLFSVNNPNKVRSLIGTFAFYNVKGFHEKNGLGYKYLVDNLIEIDPINPQVASRLVTPLIQFAKFDEHIQYKMKSQLQRLFGVKNLSKDLFEKISKALS